MRASRKRAPVNTWTLTRGARPPILWWLAVGLAVPAFVLGLAKRYLEPPAPPNVSSQSSALWFLGPVIFVIQLAVLAGLRVHRPFAHGVWVGIFTAVGWLVAAILWYLGVMIQDGTFGAFAYTQYFLYALPAQILFAVILGSLAMLAVRFLPPRGSDGFTTSVAQEDH